MVVTLGADGGVLFAANKQLEYQAQTVERVVDTTGAGDAFAAGFLAKYAQGINLETCIEAGRWAAAETVQHIGAVPQ